MDVHTGVKTSSWHQANLNFLTSFFLFFGVSPGVLGDDLNSDATMVKFVFAFSFTRLLYAVPLRININVQIIDEDQCQGNKEWGKQRASITIGTMNKDTCAFVSEFGQVCC